jgi:hypothetical protein
MIYWLRSARADLKLSPPLSPPARFFQIKIKEALAPQAQVQKASDLPPKADMCGATRDVRFGPEADMTRPIRSLRRREARMTHALRDQAPLPL